MQYPCIVYRRERINVIFADNDNYQTQKRYMVTVIDQNPDSDIPEKVAKLPLCGFSRAYAADNLNHNVFRLHF